MNCTPLNDNWPAASTAYSFEVVNFTKSCQVVQTLTSWAFPITFVYVVGVHLGQYLMRNRAPFDLRRPLIFWNAGLALASAVAVWRMFPETYSLFRKPDGFYNSVCFLHSLSYETYFWLLVMGFCKVLELGDTVFLILRKRKVMFLHWFHHATVLLGTFLYAQTYDPGFRMVGLINCFVHAIMYSYFAFMASGFKLRKRFGQAITTLQIIQLLAGFIGNNYILFFYVYKNVPCDRPIQNIKNGNPLALAYILLFGHYFFRSYIQSNKGKAKKK